MNQYETPEVIVLNFSDVVELDNSSPSVKNDFDNWSEEPGWGWD